MHKFSKIFTAILTMCSTILAAEIHIPFSCEAGLGYDYFRSLPEGDWEGNTGALASLNLSMPLPYLAQYGIGGQIGSSYGNYDWCGRGSSPSGKQTGTQQQIFLTGAIFRKTPYCSGINLGLAYDWMWNKNAGVFAIQNSIAQLRFQGGYLIYQTDELGIWSTLDVHTSHRHSQGIPVSFRAVSQVNLYWEHHFANCAKTMIWGGVPYKKSLMYSTGRAGKFILGADFYAPLTYQLGLEGHASYMKGHSASGALKQRNYAANICLEIKWSFGCRSYASQSYLPIGNNSNFITDTNITF